MARDEIPGKTLLENKNIAAEKRDALMECIRKLAPEAISGDNVLSWDTLKLAVGEAVDSDDPAVKLELRWPCDDKYDKLGRAAAIKTANMCSEGTFKPCREESVDFDNTENIFIEGDNLEAIKLLLNGYKEKIKMIYIDPPYNTGNDFVYPDDYTESMETYLRYTGQKDEEGRNFSANQETAGRFHSKWLSMMYPRLYLARDLLREDGVIFISIDDNEQARLKLMCDEIFGEGNFVANIIWEKVHTRKNSAKYFSVSHDYILCYTKNKECWDRILLPREETDAYTNPDNDSNGPWKPDPITAHNFYDADYKITKPNGVVLSRPQGRYWCFSEKTLGEKIKNNEIIWGEGDAYPMAKRYLSYVKAGLVPVTFDRKFAGDSSLAKGEMDDLFGWEGIFSYPKPTKLIIRLLQISTQPNDIILDFFAGSCTTAHAVMKLNAEDGGNRKFIMIQLPEKCKDDSEAFKAGYKTIADIGKERIRRAARKIRDEYGLTAPKDLGFKVFKLSESCFKKSRDIEQRSDGKHIQMFLDEIKDLAENGTTKSSCTQEDILFETILKKRLPLTGNVRKKTMANKTVFAIGDTVMMCFEDRITEELIKEMAKEKPSHVVFLDRAFHGSDELKFNAMAILRFEGNDLIFECI